MSKILVFRFYGDPIAWASPTIAHRGNYKPPKHRFWQKKLQAQLVKWREKYPADIWDGELLSGPLELSILFLRQRPKSVELIVPEKAPDLGNFDKSFCDAFKGIVWVDDALIVNFGKYKKVWADSIGQKPGACCVIKELTEEDIEKSLQEAKRLAEGCELLQERLLVNLEDFE